MSMKLFRPFKLASTAIHLLLILAVVGMMNPLNRADAQDLKEHFDGKTINLIIGSGAGGGYDIVARIFAKHAAKHFPGTPNFIVRNMTGSSGLKATQYMYRAKGDGLTAGPHFTHLVMKELAGIDVPGFEIDKLIIVGANTYVKDDYMICADRNVVKSWEDMVGSGKKFRMAAQRPGGGRVPMGAEFVDLVGGPIKMVYGYKTVAEELAAFARRETEVVTCLDRRFPRFFPEVVKQKRLLPLFWWNAKPTNKWLETLGGPEPRQVLELPGLKTTEEQRNAFNTAVTIHQFLRAFMLPPSTPPAIVKVWRDAFKATTEDPAFVKAANDAGYDVGYGAPTEYEDQWGKIKKLSPDGKKFFRRLIGDR